MTNVPVKISALPAAGALTGAEIFPLVQLGATVQTPLSSIGQVANVASRTFAQLPVSPATGMVSRVTNSTTATWGATISGGGANSVLAWYNGTNWTVIGS